MFSESVQMLQGHSIVHTRLVHVYSMLLFLVLAAPCILMLKSVTLYVTWYWLPLHAFLPFTSGTQAAQS